MNTLYIIIYMMSCPTLHGLPFWNGSFRVIVWSLNSTLIKHLYSHDLLLLLGYDQHITYACSTSLKHWSSIIIKIRELRNISLLHDHSREFRIDCLPFTPVGTLKRQPPLHDVRLAVLDVNRRGRTGLKVPKPPV